jgi:hypothetical protein
MAWAMIETVIHANPGATVETVLHHELAHGDALIGTIAPILRHLLANDEHSVFSDEIIGPRDDGACCPPAARCPGRSCR